MCYYKSFKRLSNYLLRKQQVSNKLSNQVMDYAYSQKCKSNQNLFKKKKKKNHRILVNMSVLLHLVGTCHGLLHIIQIHFDACGTVLFFSRPFIRISASEFQFIWVQFMPLTLRPFWSTHVAFFTSI